MATKVHMYNLNNSHDAQKIANELRKRWLEVEKIPGIFRYRLNVRKERIMDGMFGFLLQLNIERGRQRRVPIIIKTLEPKFNEDAFNFTQIKINEKLLDIQFEDFIVTVLVNQSPISPFHCLLVPRLNDKLPQILRKETITFAIRLLRTFNSPEFHIGYNSPGAAASVNHQHLHLIHSTREYFAQRAEIEKLRSGIYRLSSKYEINAVCFVLHRLTNDENEKFVSERVYKLVNYMLQHIIPHNVFFTLAKHKGELAMRILVYPHDQMCLVKSTTELNIAFCEFSGFIPIADEDLYNNMTEKFVLDAIKSQQCDVFDKIESMILHEKY